MQQTVYETMGRLTLCMCVRAWVSCVYARMSVLCVCSYECVCVWGNIWLVLDWSNVSTQPCLRKQKHKSLGLNHNPLKSAWGYSPPSVVTSMVTRSYVNREARCRWDFLCPHLHLWPPAWYYSVVLPETCVSWLLPIEHTALVHWVGTSSQS